MEKVDDIRLMHDYKWLKCIHLQGKDRTVEIESVTDGTVEGEKGRKSRKPVLRFKGKKLPFAISKTDTNTLVILYGSRPSALIGKRITLYPTTTTLGGKVVDCIRIRPYVPKDPADTGPDQDPPPSDTNGDAS